MRLNQITFILLCLVLLTGCERSPAELRFVTPTALIDRDIAADLVDLLDRESTVHIDLTSTPASEESALDVLLEGTADIALVSNNMPFRAGISTIMPLYPAVLHIGFREGRDSSSGIELFRDAKVYAGSVGSASRLMFEKVAARQNLAATDFSYVDDPTSADVFTAFAPISPDRLEQFPDIRLFSLGFPGEIGQGSLVDAATLLNPQLKPFIIPIGTYGDATPHPVLTVAVDMMLVARADLGTSVVYDLVHELLRLRPALAALRPGLFQRLSDDFDAGNSTFVLHPGLLAYTQRNAPTIYERYAGVVEVATTLCIGLFSAIFAATRVFRMRRKNRIDTFYSEVIAIRQSIHDLPSRDARAVAADELRALQTTAFELLVDEKLAADESFRIFISLSNDVLRELGATAIDSRLSDQ